MFRNREEAAIQLAARLAPVVGDNPLILAIPRGGVPMGRILADALDGELDVVLVRKVRAADNPELALGGVDEAGRLFLHSWATRYADASWLDEEIARQMQSIADRRERYTPVREPIDPCGRTVVVVDDGVATGATFLVALRAVRAREPAMLIAATGVGGAAELAALGQEADQVVSVANPDQLGGSVGRHYQDFSQVSDDTVVRLLKAER